MSFTVALDAVRKEFRRNVRPALAGVTATVRPGVVTGLAGPDGAGKTTLIRLMAGLLAPSAGTVRINGLDPVADAGKLRELVGYMPQRFGLYEDLTVRENLDLYADLHGLRAAERAAKLDRLFAFTDLAPFQTRLAGRLSGGMKQKLGLACTLLGSPQLLLLDEPGVGVDPISRRELWKMVHELLAGGMSVVWSTAYLDEAALCDEVLLLNEGVLLFAGRPQDLTARLQGRCLVVSGFAGSRRDFLRRVRRRPEIIDGSIQGSNVRLLLGEGGIAGPNNELEPGGCLEVIPDAPRFEDAFIDLLGGAPGGESAIAAHVQAIPLDGRWVIEAEALTRTFGSFVAADHVSFSVKRGEIFGLLGPNGAGKSTTFKMICGLLAPTSGSARILGLDLRHRGVEARQRMGYMAQKFSLYGNLSVRQNLVFFSGLYGLKGAAQRQTVADFTEVFGFGPQIDASADTLPLGFKQRLSLACALMHAPDILFLDEPTSGVDPVTRREFWTHINGLVEKGVTVVVTTHFMDEAEYCDRVGLVFRGQMIAAGTPEELRQMAATVERPAPNMEDAFIELVGRHR